MIWHDMATAPKDGTDILICMPGGMSDHYYPVCWTEPDEDDDFDTPRWQCRWNLGMTLTEEQIAACHLKPMWTRLEAPPSSLMVGNGIRQEFCPKTRDRPHDYAHHPVGTDGRRVDQMQPDKEYAAGMFCRHCGKPK